MRSVGSTSSAGRRRRRYAPTASAAGSPSGSRRTLAPFPSTVTVRRRQIDVADVEPAALADAQPGAVEELEHREVAAVRRAARAPLGRRFADADAVAERQQRRRVGCGAARAATSCGPSACAGRRRRRGVSTPRRRRKRTYARTAAALRAIVGRAKPARLEVREVAAQRAVVERGRIRAAAALAPRDELVDVVRVRAPRVRAERRQRRGERVCVVGTRCVPSLIASGAGAIRATVVVTPAEYVHHTGVGRGHDLPRTVPDARPVDAGSAPRRSSCSRSSAAPRCAGSTDRSSPSRCTSRAACRATRSSACPTRPGASRANACAPRCLSSDLDWPMRRVTVNLAPADVRKTGPGLELAVAIALAGADERLPAGVARRPRRARRARARRPGAPGAPARSRSSTRSRAPASTRVIVPEANAHEAALVPGVDVRVARSLGELHLCLKGELPWPDPPDPPARRRATPRTRSRSTSPRCAACGTPAHALAIAAAGCAPPAVRRAAGRRQDDARPPAPDDPAAAHRRRGARGHEDPLGRGSRARRRSRAAPGRSARRTTARPRSRSSAAAARAPDPARSRSRTAARSFLDELAEFPPVVLDALRQPLEERVVRISRASGTIEFPADFLLVACCNPCPCGRVEADCRCSDVQRARYLRRLSAPLLDRFDLRLAGARRRSRDAPPGRPRPTCARRSTAAVARQEHRLAATPWRRNAPHRRRRARGARPVRARRRRDLARRVPGPQAQRSGRGAHPACRPHDRRPRRPRRDHRRRRRAPRARCARTSNERAGAHRPAGRGGDARVAPAHHAGALRRLLERFGGPEAALDGGRRRRRRRRPCAAIATDARATSRSCGRAPRDPTRRRALLARRGTHVWIDGDDDYPIRDEIPGRPPVLFGEGCAPRRVRRAARRDRRHAQRDAARARRRARDRRVPRGARE